MFGDDFAGGAVDDEGVAVVDEDEGGCADVGASDGEVAEFSGVAEADSTGSIDFFVSGSPGFVVERLGGFCFGECGVGLVGCAVVEGSVGALGVVDVCRASDFVAGRLIES
ncbi:hypothetical protein JT358_03105 [Micrococcales bacterium 31B]|nr:hypothetical protein [Micrococcales bacterium 31B]